MATCREVITRAFRRLGVFASGEDPPAENEADGLACLKGLLTGAISHSAQKGLARVLISAAYTANENELVAADENGPYTITLPTKIKEYISELAQK